MPDVREVTSVKHYFALKQSPILTFPKIPNSTPHNKATTTVINKAEKILGF